MALSHIGTAEWTHMVTCESLLLAAGLLCISTQQCETWLWTMQADLLHLSTKNYAPQRRRRQVGLKVFIKQHCLLSLALLWGNLNVLFYTFLHWSRLVVAEAQATLHINELAASTWNVSGSSDAVNACCKWWHHLQHTQQCCMFVDRSACRFYWSDCIWNGGCEQMAHQLGVLWCQ